MRYVYSFGDGKADGIEIPEARRQRRLTIGG